MLHPHYAVIIHHYEVVLNIYGETLFQP